MKSKSTKKRKTYRKPVINVIKIDRGISMVMQSDPPGDPSMKAANPFR